MAFAFFNEMMSDRCSRISGSNYYDFGLRRERLCTSMGVDRVGIASPV
jgi:hypothetical protein